MKTSILSNPRLRHKFCSKWNRIFGCKDAYMCNIACPFWAAFYVQELMNNKNYSLGEAIRQTIRESINKGEGRKIIKDIVYNKDKIYPPEGWKDKWERKDESTKK